MAEGSDIAQPPAGEKRPRIGFLAPATIVGFIALTLVGSYYVRLRLLERAMSSAVEIGDEKTIGELLGAWPCPVNPRGGPGGLPLHWAAANGRSDLVERCLARHADVNALGRPGAPEDPNTSPSTALFWAVFTRRGDIVQILVAHGADPNIDGDQDLPLVRAAENGDEEMVALLLSLGARLAARDSSGRTALQVAEGRRGHAAEILRAHGVEK